MKTVLTIAGTDPSGGAGLHADLKTFTAHGVYGMGVVTAVLAQNTCGVTGIEKISQAMIEAQMEAVFTDIFPDAVKIGMVSDCDTIATVSGILRKYRVHNVVFDTVMVASSGHRLLERSALDALIRDLLPCASVITPNIPEAEVLCGFEIKTLNDMKEGARKIASFYSGAILIKGGHLANTCDDVLYVGGTFFTFSGKKIERANTHGTGCTLSASIAAHLALGLSIPDAVRLAKEYVSGSLSQGLSLGKGNGPLDHCWNMVKL